uniref:Uncharacterized protein n=1 Tax=Arundo donax TaxID=35708 RepID=A0A0A9FKJ5_ARUDO
MAKCSCLIRILLSGTVTLHMCSDMHH